MKNKQIRLNKKPLILFNLKSHLKAYYLRLNKICQILFNLSFCIYNNIIKSLFNNYLIIKNTTSYFLSNLYRLNKISLNVHNSRKYTII